MTRTGKGPTTPGTVDDMETATLDLRTLVAHRREQLGLSLRGLGNRAGISYSTINKIENGDTKHPSEEVMKGLAIGLDLPVSRLREATGAPSEPTEFRLPARAKNLTDRQRRAILAMIDALLDET